MKFIKVAAHFRKYPRDIVYFPGYLVFGYWCTVVKLWALLTCWNASWATEKVSSKVKETKRAVTHGRSITATQVETVTGPSSVNFARRPHLQHRGYLHMDKG